MKSLWQQDIDLPGFPSLDHDLTCDVLIIGGGLAGILCAYQLKQSGVDCVLIEANEICSGVSAKTTAKITAQHGLCYHAMLQRFGPELTQGYLRANLEAVERWKQLCQQFPCDFKETDNYIYTLQHPEKLKLECSALEQLGYPAHFVKALPLPLPVCGAVKFAHQGQFDPLKLVAGLAGTLPIYERTTAQSYDGEHIVTDRAAIRAKKIIVATHFPIFNKHGSYFLKLYQHRSYVLALEGAGKLDGMFLDEDERGLSFRSHKDLLLLGGGSHKTGKNGGGWRELEAFARKHYPNASIRSRWATQDCMTLDDVPYIGQYSKSTPNLYVATGFNKWGMTTSMVAAILLSELVQGRTHPWAKVFSPKRSMLHPQLATNGISSLLNLLTPTTPRCPHMGCALKWNRQEHTWDCPCHGSRFAEDGTVLNNPATGNLKHVKKQDADQ